MKEFAKSLFELEQTVPIHEKVDPRACLPGKTSVSATVNELVRSFRSQFVEEMANWSLKNKGDVSVSVDGVHLKANGRHHHYFTAH